MINKSPISREDALSLETQQQVTQKMNSETNSVSEHRKGMLLIFQGLPVRAHIFNLRSLCSPQKIHSLVSEKLILNCFSCSSKPNKGIAFLCLFIESFNNRQFGSNGRNPQPKTIKVAVCVVYCCCSSELQRSRRNRASVFPVAKHMPTAGRHGKLDSPWSHTLCQIREILPVASINYSL